MCLLKVFKVERPTILREKKREDAGDVSTWGWVQIPAPPPELLLAKVTDHYLYL
jgi:hypothetical protein